MEQQNLVTGSIRDLKKEISDLRDQMVGYNRESSEYAALAQQAREKTAQLNNILQDSKRDTAAAADSMNALKESLKQMKAEVGNMDIGTQEFKDLSAKIKDTTDKLKDLEASQGTFSRNVGNYAGGVIEAFGAMGVNVSKLQGAFNIATSAGSKFNNVLTIIKKHPIIATLSILSTLLYAVYNKIKDNEVAARKWKVAMSAFQPIVDAFNRVMGFLGEKLADAALWLADKLPDAVKVTGKALSVLTKVVGSVITSFVYLATRIPVLMWSGLEKMGDGFEWITEKLGIFARAIGADDMADNIDKFGARLNNMVHGASNTMKGIFDGTITWLKNITDSTSKYLDQLGDNYKKAALERQSLQQRQFDLDDRMDAQKKLSAESELRQAELYNKIYQTTGKERLKLIAELRQEIEANGKREVEIAKEQYAIRQRISELAPNSEEENDLLDTLNANITKAEANYVGSLKRVTRLEESTEKTITSTTKSENDKRIKAEQEAYKQRIENGKKYLAALATTLESINNDSEERSGNNESVKTTLEAQGLFSIDKQIEYENERYKIVRETNEKVIAEYKKAVESEELTEEQKLAIVNKYSKAVIDANTAKYVHIAEMNKLTLKQINDDAIEQTNLLKESFKANDVVSIYTDMLKNVNKDDILGWLDVLKVTPEQKQEILDNYNMLNSDIEQQQVDYYLRQEDIARDHNLALLEIKKEELGLLAFNFGEDSEMYLEAQQAYNAAVESEEQRHVKAMLDIYNKDEKNNDKHNKQKAASYMNYVNSVGNLVDTLSDIYKQELDEKVKTGEMTEEQAKKQFEDIKQMQIATTIISTIAGAAQAFELAMATYSAPAGAIIGAAQAATALATGYAKVREIESTSFGSSSGGGSGGVSRGSTSIDFSGVRVNPIINEDSDMNRLSTIPVTSTSEQRVYILQSDITDSNKQVEIRQSNTTF